MSRQQYDDTNRGVLFKNDRKEQESHADLKGTINIDGKEYWLSAWTKKNEAGGFKLFSLSVKPKEARDGQGDRRKAFGSGESRPRGQSQNQQNKFADDFQDDDIPW